MFVSDRKGILLENEASGTGYAEITCPDDELSILTGADEEGEEARFTAMAPYNKNTKLRVAGVISSAETASMVMGFREDGSQDRPLALRGRVLCKVDAGYGEIKPGDLLTSSPTPGHAMRAEPIIEKDGRKIYGQGVILGKAIEPLKEGKGKILILVCLM